MPGEYPTWPASLRQRLPIRAPEAYVDQRVAFDPDAGPSILWSRATVPPRIIDVPGPAFLHWTWQKTILEEFIAFDLVGGGRPFEWAEPWPHAGLKVFQFHSLPIFTSLGSGRTVGARVRQVPYAVAFQLIERPWYPVQQIG
jgi:hypothetical protein